MSFPKVAALLSFNLSMWSNIQITRPQGQQRQRGSIIFIVFGPFNIFSSLLKNSLIYIFITIIILGLLEEAYG